MNKNYYAVIMAGGVGSRFWPVSTTANPKQFHDMLGTGQTLIQQTFSRLNKFVPTQNIIILTNQRYNDLVLEQLPQLKQNQVVLEPAMRNTAPCILYAALKINKLNPNAAMIVAPSDHFIENEEAFAANVQHCFDKCLQEEVLCTLGIQPDSPNTGFGYIEFEKNDPQSIKKVVQFREKPNLATAKSFLKAGNFLWNAGIFMWQTKTIINAFKKYQPKQYHLFEKGLDMYNTPSEKAFIIENYPKAENISIDYAILEQSNAIYTLPATFKWNDLGTWGALYDKLDKDQNGNAVVNSQVVLENSHGNMVSTKKGKVVVIDGLKDYIIVDKEEVLLIYPKHQQQDIKKVRATVGSKFGENYT